MNEEESHRREREVEKRIASLMQSIGHGPKKHISGEELQKLKTAASRLEQILQSAADDERQALNNAASRLDQLLTDIRKGKDVTHNLKRRERNQRDKS